MKQVKSLTVVGGGTAGLITAIILKIRCNIDVTVIHSSNIGIVGVGEGSTEHFSEFMKFANIKPSEIINECDATFKTGVLFENWSNKKYMHSVWSDYSSNFGQYFNIYAKQISENKDIFFPKYLYDNLCPKDFILDFDNFPKVNQYHFNTFKLNDFLIKIAKKNNITFFDDEIKEVILKEDGYIDELIGIKQKYRSDFYIDATGFQKILMNKLDNKWISFANYLKMKSAITFPIDDLENKKNYNIWTLSKAMSAGWRFQIPVVGRTGNGYIYDSDFINADQAKLEVEKDLGHKVEIKKHFNFDPGMLENIWKKNCVAVGLSGSFFEPLEATSIGLSIQQSFLLMHKIANYDDKVINDYNKNIKEVIENIRDFIVLHYINNKNNTEFWKNILTLEIPDSLKNNLEKWKTKMPINEDFSGISSYKMFGAHNFILVLQGLNLFNNDAISKEYNLLSNNLKKITEKNISDLLQNENNTECINHADAISYIRNNYGKY